MLRIAGTAVRWLVDLVLPPRCLGCGTEVDAQGAFCPSCWGTLRFLGQNEGCFRCGVPFEEAAGEGMECGACLLHPPAFSKARSAFVYDGAIRSATLAMKHRDRPEHARTLARHIGRVAAELWREGEAVFVPVPLHRWRLWGRGFNQAALLAETLAREAARTCVRDALVRTRRTRPQQGLSRTERQKNLRGALGVAPHRASLLKGRPVVLVDDVLTTGATADCAADALLSAGALDVRVVTLARVVAGQTGNHIGGVTR